MSRSNKRSQDSLTLFKQIARHQYRTDRGRKRTIDTNFRVPEVGREVNVRFMVPILSQYDIDSNSNWTRIYMNHGSTINETDWTSNRTSDKKITNSRTITDQTVHRQRGPWIAKMNFGSEWTLCENSDSGPGSRIN